MILIHQRHRQTDGQTDGRTDGRTTCNLNTALCTSASRSKKQREFSRFPGDGERYKSFGLLCLHLCWILMLYELICIRSTIIGDGEFQWSFLKNKAFKHQPTKQRSNTCYSAPLQASPTSEALRYMARTKQRRTYLPYTFPAVAGTHLPTPKGWRVE